MDAVTMDIDTCTPGSSQAAAREHHLMQQISKADLSRKAAEVVRYFLLKQCDTSFVKRSDISKDVLLDFRKFFDPIMKLAQKELENIYGMEVMVIPRKDTTSQQQSGAADALKGNVNKQSSEKRYFLRNVLLDEKQNIIGHHDRLEEYGLLALILAVIYMTGGTIKGSDLAAKLGSLGIGKSNDHPVFGDVFKVIDRFVKDMYLFRSRDIVNSEYVYEYSWGERSELVVSKMEILQLVSDLLGVPVESWSNQLEEANKQVL